MPEGEGVPDVEEEPEEKGDEEIINEQMFTFHQFEQVQWRSSLSWEVRLLTSLGRDSRIRMSLVHCSRTLRDTASSHPRSK